MGTSYMYSTIPATPSPIEQRVHVQEITSEVQPSGSDQDSSTDSAYSSDDHAHSNESNHGSSEPFQGVDLDRLFERRHSPGKKSHNRKTQPEPIFVAPPSLLPAPALVGGYLPVSSFS